MSITEIGAFAVILTGLVTAVVGYVRASRADKRSDAAQKAAITSAADAALVTNFQALFDEQKERIGRIDAELTRVKDEQTKERAQWAEERKVFQSKLDEKDKIIRRLTKEIGDLRRQVNKDREAQGVVNDNNTTENHKRDTIKK